MLRTAERKKNILILVTAAIGGGVERLILDQMRYYDRDRFNLHVVTLREGYMEKEFSATDAHYSCLRSTRRFSWRTLRQLVNYVRRHRIEIVHTHLYLPDIYGFLVKAAVPRIKLVTTKHNTNDFRKKIYWGLLDHLLSRPASCVIAVSRSVQKFISRYEFIPSKRITVIYHGVDVSRFRRHRTAAKQRAELNIKRNDFVIGIVGRLTRQKGHKYLLEAVSILARKTKEVRLLVIGTGELEQELRQYSRTLGIEKYVDFLGYRGDVAELYSLMNVLCLPSIFEGLGLALVEAMMCGIPVIGARVDGITEIIEDGVNGYLFPPRDSAALVDILFKIYKSGPDKKMIEHAESSALRFDFRKNLKNIEREYLKALATN